MNAGHEDDSSNEDLPFERIVSNSNNFEKVAGLHEDNLHRNGQLGIKKRSSDENGEHFWVYGLGDDLFPPQKSWEADIPLTSLDLFAHVERCRNVWAKEIVNGYPETKANPEGGWKNSFPFQEHFEFETRPELLQASSLCTA